ncbi:hypothetical protein PVK06_025398 [Gossypium arboreum]|uniref:Carboxypeptidase n=1 Tax=Gossypium arboreum TaxID=29729 RepID=A0ABR0PGG7_GOSAR|nr:hypothetical protein PVK06_025398 [Gossypium arboreum]
MYGFEAMTFNIHGGYLEAIVRGHRAGLLTAADYNNLCQCETLDDIKMHLSATEYGPYLQNEPSPLHTTTIVEKCTLKLVDEYKHMLCQATEPLSTFLEYITYGHMIDNVVLIVTGTLHERDVQELLEKCHPLGMFDSIATLAVAQNMRELYRLVLVDTPLAPYFSECITSEDLDDMNIEIMRNTLYKAYLEDFYKFCQKLGGATAEIMSDLLAFEADRRAVNITINSIGTELTRDDRRKLYSNFGLLYPYGHEELAVCEDIDQVRAAMEKYPPYQSIFSRLSYGESQMLDKAFYEEEVKRLCLAFEQQVRAELIPSLPGQQDHLSFRQYSGYIVTDAEHGRALFYYFVECSSNEDVLHPLTLWLNGGPGCSSLGFGAFMENGPFQPGENGTLIKNPYSWNIESHMLYLESPIGVGFSYSNTSKDYIDWNDTQTAEDNYRFILKWLEEFPQFKDCDFFLAGESYAGHYIPQLAALLVEHNKNPNVEPVNLKAIALGNPLLDLDISVLAGDYLWSHGAISDETLFLEKTVCNDSKYMREYVHSQWSQGCNDVFNRVSDEVSLDVGFDDLLLPVCTSSSNVEQFKLRSIYSAGDPCLKGRIFSYLNKPEVQKALHANTTHLPFHWDFCLGPLVYQEENIDMNLIPLVSNLIKEGIPVLLYSGDQDAKIPLTQTRIIANNIAKELNLSPFSNYGTWYDQKQVGGWTQSFGGEDANGNNVTYLTFATVRGAAHEVPFTSPSQALTLFHSFVNGIPLPRPSN